VAARAEVEFAGVAEDEVTLRRAALPQVEVRQADGGEGDCGAVEEAVGGLEVGPVGVLLGQTAGGVGGEGGGDPDEAAGAAWVAEPSLGSVPLRPEGRVVEVTKHELDQAAGGGEATKPTPPYGAVASPAPTTVTQHGFRLLSEVISG